MNMSMLFRNVIFLLIGILSCIKEPDNKYSSDQAQLQLTSTGSSIETKLEWTIANTSSFIEYIVVSSTTDIPIAKKVSEIRTTDILARIPNSQQNFLTNFNLFTTSKIRVFANLGSNLVYSNQIEIAPNIFQLKTNNTVKQTLVDPTKGILFTINTSGLIERIDLNVLKSTHSAIVSGLSTSDDIVSALTQFENKSELYIPIGNKINVYNADDLTLNSTIINPSNNTIYNVVADGQGHIFFTDAAPNIPHISRYDLASKTIIRIGDIANTYRMIKISKNGKKVFAGSRTSATAIRHYELNDSGIVINRFLYAINPIEWNDFLALDIDENGNHLAVKNPAGIYNNQITRIGNFNTAANSILKSVRITDDNQFITLFDVGNNEVSFFDNISPFKFSKKYKFKSTGQIHHLNYKNEPYILGFLTNPRTGAFVLVLEKGFIQ